MASQISRRQLRRGERGASAVEFALIIPLLVMLLIGTVTAGLVYADHVSVTNAAREGARYGAAADAASTSWATSVQTRVQQVYFNAAGTAPTNDQVCVRLITSTGTTLASDLGTSCGTEPACSLEHGHRQLCGARVDGEAGTHQARRRPRPPQHPEREVRVVLREDGRHDMHRRLIAADPRGRAWCHRHSSSPSRCRSCASSPPWCSTSGSCAWTARSTAPGPTPRPSRGCTGCSAEATGTRTRTPACARRCGTSRRTTPDSTASPRTSGGRTA